MTLHTLNRAPSDTTCRTRCLQALAAGDALLLIEDGVYNALPGHAATLTTLPEGVSVYALQPDLEARGITALIDAKVKHVDDAGFVTLACEHDKVVSWF